VSKIVMEAFALVSTVNKTNEVGRGLSLVVDLALYARRLFEC
jgi:hypothetical protein